MRVRDEVKIFGRSSIRISLRFAGILAGDVVVADFGLALIKDLNDKTGFVGVMLFWELSGSARGTTTWLSVVSIPNFSDEARVALLIKAGNWLEKDSAEYTSAQHFFSSSSAVSYHCFPR